MSHNLIHVLQNIPRFEGADKNNIEEWVNEGE